MKVCKRFLIFLLVFLSISTASAINPESEESGDLGHDETDIGLSEFSGRADPLNRPTRVVDEAYELGKSVYYGRKNGIPDLSYCVMVEDQKKKLKRKTIKPYKNTTFSNLASNLYNCNSPENYIKTDLSKNDFLHVLYYLDIRYKLNLKRE